jgi:1-acyl-sn-glycerol-3-phosphate acyltransferase
MPAGSLALHLGTTFRPRAGPRRRSHWPTGRRVARSARHNGQVIYEVVHTVAPPLLKLIWRPRVFGVGNIPPTGGVILASNHLSFVDSVVIPSLVSRKVVFLAKADYFNGRGLKGTAQRWWFEGIGMLPVDRDNTQSAVDSLDTALEVLGRGEAFGIYPEGSRSRDGRLYRGRTGVAHLALTAGVPVVPVGLQGTEKIQPIGSTRPKIARVTVKFGAPLDFSGRADGVPLGRARREVTDEIMEAIQELSGQEPAGVYNERGTEA